MSSLKIEERFELDAHADQAWVFLTQPARIVVCLPGAELTEDIDERNYAGGVTVKLGAVTMHYKGTVEFTELDHERRLIRMEGKGLEKRGGGTVSLTMEGRVRELEGNRCEVAIVADIRLAGKIVRFGRGMIQAVTAEVFKEFTERLAEELSSDQPLEEGAGKAEEAGEDEGPKREESSRREEGSRSEALPLLPLLIRTLRTWVRRLVEKDPP